jgi:outer membrane autotransporter protein
LIGIAVGATTSGFSVDQRSTSGKADGFHAGAYGVKRFGRFYLSGTTGYARFENETTRHIVGIGPTERAEGNFTSDTLSARLEAGWRQAWGEINVTPFAGLEVVHLRSQSFAENSVVLGGAPGIFGLAYGSHSATSLPSSLGAQIDTRLELVDGTTLYPFARLAWVHEFHPERRIDAALISLPEASFIVEGARAATDAAKVSAGLRLELSKGVGLYTTFEGEFSGHTESYTGAGGIRIIW